MQIRVRELNKIIEELKEEIKILKEKDVNPQKEET